MNHRATLRENLVDGADRAFEGADQTSGARAVCPGLPEPRVVEKRLISSFSQKGGGNSTKDQQLSAIAIRHPFIFFSIADKNRRRYSGHQGRRRRIWSPRPRSGR
jgi:hypothetical protein